MIEGVYMTEKDLSRLEVFTCIKKRQISQIKEAVKLNLSLRQVQRLYSAFKKTE